MQLGYRRLFDVNSLVGLRVEREHVFEETHALVLGLAEERECWTEPCGSSRWITCDPREYLMRLRERTPEAWIVGEKILEPGEFLRESWPIQGTTGYDFMHAASECPGRLARRGCRS